MNLNLDRLQGYLAKNNIEASLLSAHDQFFCECPPCYDKRLQWLTGFSGSFAVVIVTAKQCYFFTDSRYILQAKKELDPSCQIFDIAKTTPWGLANKLGLKVFYDPKLVTYDYLQKFSCCALAAKINPVDALWKRKNQKKTKIFDHPIKYCGKSSAEKRREIASDLPYFFTNPESVCWLLNIRGNDIENTPIVLCRAILYPDAAVKLFIENDNFELQAKTERQIEILSKSKLEDCLKYENKIALDPKCTSKYYLDLIGDEKVEHRQDPCIIHKACKNQTEIDGAINAHKKDAKALVKFFGWLKKNVGCTEVDAANAVLNFRKEQDLFYCQSFETISAFGKNGAIVHYHPTEGQNDVITKENLYLIDSGGQYLDGTTDVTRTVCLGRPTKQQIFHYTIVLKAHIAIATAVFSPGITGKQLDTLARIHLWKHGLDYGHGTGHGVGSFLNVHEGPQSFGNDIPIKQGMIMSNEPGIYIPDQYGIRLENLMYVKKNSNGFFYFEVLTLVPFQENLIDKNLLTKEEKSWLFWFSKKMHLS